MASTAALSDGPYQGEQMAETAYDVVEFVGTGPESWEQRHLFE